MRSNILDILLLLILSVIANSNFYAPYVDTNTYYLISILLKLAYLIFLVFYMRKYHPWYLEFERPRKKQLLLLPFLILPFTNLFISLISGETIVLGFSYVIGLAIIETLFIVIIEEMIFRVLFFNALRGGMSILNAILISALIFGITHLVNFSIYDISSTLLQVVYSFVLGIILAFTLYFGRNIIYPMILHFLFNVFNGIVINYMFALEYSVLYFGINIGAGVLALLYTYFLYKKYASY